ncbi:hypothetical protein Tco_1043079 [Tanacetum coccineum]|uniref:Uncharacterized protein n=1 Tax=Tanacetum coccineum TaxID=301880 RepID=A0ABQ5GMD4_9ASTR
MESLISNFQEIELHETQLVVKQLHSVRMLWFKQLKTHLSNLYHNKLSRAVDAFKPAFLTFFGVDHQTFRLKMFHNLDQLKLQFKKENLHEVHAKTCLEALHLQFKEYFASPAVNSSDHLSQCWQEAFNMYMYCDPETYRRNLIEYLDMLVDVLHESVLQYGILRMKENEVNALKENGRQLHDEILHEHQIMKSVKMQSQYIQSIFSVQAVDDSSIVSKNSLIESKNNNALSKSEIETQMHMREEKVDMREALDVGLVVTESSGTNPDKQDTSSSSENYTTHAVDANIGPVNDEEPFAEVQLTAQHNILANEQQHTEQSEPSYDTYLLETIDSNTTPNSTNMCHRGGEIVQGAEQVKSPLLNAEFFRTKDMVENDVYNELSNRFLKLEKHCISLEIQIQQKEESFQSNNPCMNQDLPEFHEFFVINDLKAQLQAKTTLIYDLKKQIKSVKEASNEAKVKDDIDVIETINIELEHINQKSIKNADLKAQFQEKVFANAALKNELRKIKGNSMDTKFAKASILGKPPLQPSRNHLVVRQPNAITSEQPRMSRPRFASQVDEKNDLSKTVTPHYLPKVRESAAAKPHQVNAPNYSRNSHKESYGSNDMVHAYFLEDARKMTKDKTGIPNHRDMALVECQMVLNKVNLLGAKVSVRPNRNNNPVEPKNHTHKPGRQIGIGQRFSLNKSSVVHEKPRTPRSYLRWKPTGRIFKTVSLRWIPTRKMFIDSITKVNSKPPNGSNDDITNPYECNQTLYFSAGTSNSSAGTSVNPLKERLRVWLPKRPISHTSGVQGIQI